MANNAVIGALRVVLGADTVAFDKGLKDAEKSLARFQANIAKVGTALGVGIAGAATAFGVAIGKAITNADELGKTAQKIGIPVEELSKLKHAADLSGVSMETLQGSVSRLARNMSEAATTSTSQAARAFSALGINVRNTDGSLRSSSEVIADVAGRFETMKDSAGKTALAISIFGRSGAELIPLLNAGKNGLNDMMKEAEALGIVIDTKTAKAAEAFNDNLTRLQRVFTGVATKIAAELSPSLAVLTTQVVDYAKANNVAETSAQKILGAFDIVGRAAATTAHFFASLAREAAALWEVLKAPNVDQLTVAWQRFREEGQRSQQGLDAIGTSFRDFREQAGMLAQHMATASMAVQVSTAPMIASAKSINDAIRIGEQLFKQYEAAAKSVFENTRTPMEAYGLEIAKISVLLQTGRIDAETFGRAQAQAAEKAGFSWKQQVPSIAGSFAEIANTFGKENKRIAAAAQVFSAFQALVSTYAGSAEALKLPFPLNIAASAAVLAKGLGLVAAIRSFAMPKMATGGTLIPKAFPGRDSTLMQARIRPDEQVDIVRPGEGSNLRRGSSSTSVTLNIADPFGREVIARIINGVNDLVADGYRLKVEPA